MLPPKNKGDGVLVVDLEIDKWIQVGEAFILLDEVQPGRASLVIQAPRRVQITRETAKRKGPRDGETV